MKNLKIRKKDGELTQNTKRAIAACRIDSKTKKVHHSGWSYSCGYRKLNNYSYYLGAVLTEKRFKYTEGNDAKFGGKAGDYFKVSKKAIDYLKSI